MNLPDDKIKEINKEYTITEILRDNEGEIKVVMNINDTYPVPDYVRDISTLGDKDNCIKKGFLHG